MCPAPPVAGYTSAPGGTLPAALPWGLKTLICRRDRLQYLAAPWAFPKGDAQFLPRRVSQGHPAFSMSPWQGTGGESVDRHRRPVSGARLLGSLTANLQLHLHHQRPS